MHPKEMPTHLEAGTHNLLGIAGLHAALEWLGTKQATDARNNQHTQRTRILEGLSTIKQCKIYGPPCSSDAPCCGPISFNMDGWNPSNAATALDASFGIAVRAGLHCAPLIHANIGAPLEGTIRVSPGPFTTAEETDLFLTAINKLASSV
jgi:selenocysteine lyase/cysteine desulfurase